jgi:hypothetical protein
VKTSGGYFMKKIFWVTVLFFQLLCFQIAIYPQLFNGSSILQVNNNFSLEKLPLAQEKGRKRALLVGLSYKNWGSSELNSKVSLERIVSVLINRMGFKLSDIKIITDERNLVINDNGEERTLCAASNCGNQILISPHARAIDREFENFLIRQTAPGDIALFYFVGHGTAEKVLNTKEKDGCEESLLIYKDYARGDERKAYLRDDVIYSFLQRLAGKNPANVTVILDSCFSGGAVRSDELKALRILPKKENQCLDNKTPEIRNMPENFFFLSASQSNQVAYEFDRNNSESLNDNNNVSNSKNKIGQPEPQQNKIGAIFTYYLTGELMKATPQTTYQELIERVRNSVISEKGTAQTPKVEYFKNQRLFAGTVTGKDYLFPVKFDKNRAFYLDVGRLYGMTKGSRVDLYPKGTLKPDSAKVIAKATVSEVSEWKSYLKIDDKKELSTQNQMVAIETEHNFDSVLKIAVAEHDKKRIAGRADGKDLLNLLDNSKNFAEIVDEKLSDWNIKIRYPLNCSAKSAAPTDEICKEEKDFRGLVLQRRDDSVIDRIAEDDAAKKDSFAQRLKNSLQRISYEINFLSLFDNYYSDPAISVQIKMYDGGMANSISKETGQLACNQNANPAGQEFITDNIKLAPNHCFWLELKNTGESEVYISLFNQEADKNIKGAFPSSWSRDKLTGKWGQKYYTSIPNLLYGKNTGGRASILLGPFRVNQAFGQEKYYLLATTRDFKDELTNLANSLLIDENKAGTTRQDLSPLAGILSNMGRGRRSDNEKIKDSDKWGTAIFSFQVVENELK